ncbi:hypothetical protein ASD48_20735 [Streptomyces sp. Root1310]|nr:hypothetical protein ASD48_20735 [Streptomyces sp. Root1310]
MPCCFLSGTEGMTWWRVTSDLPALAIFRLRLVATRRTRPFCLVLAASMCVSVAMKHLNGPEDGV